MYTITKLKMWKDPGYTRECVEVPPAGSRKLPAPDYSSTAPMRPRKSQIMDELQLPIPYLQVLDMSYLYIEAQDGATPANTISMFGWILSVEESASAESACTIRWTPDWWRTYSSRAVFGAGMVERCSNADLKRPYQTKPRKWVVDYKAAYSTPQFFIAITSEMTGDDVTGFFYYWAHLDQDLATRRTPSTDEVYSGRLDEVLGIIPSSIIGIWIVPYLHSSMFTGTSQMDINNVVFNKSSGISDNPVYTLTNFVTAGTGSDDLKQCVSVDPYGNICSTLPWGFQFENGNADITVDISADGVTYYIIPTEYDKEKALAEGSYLIYNGMSIPVNSNAWSEYAFTYQRSYDKRMREIQRNQQAVSGYTGMTTSVVGGSIAGATTGGPGGAVAGALAGGISSIVGTTIDYFAAGYFNDELQRETDKLVSNQTSNILSGGGGLAWYRLAKSWRVYVLKGDSVSMDEYDNHIANDGYSTEISETDCSSFITAGGPLQIQNLMITGSIPPAAKTYIKNILSNGIRIVENNPTGTDPGA